MLKMKDPDRAKELGRLAQSFTDERYELFERLAQPFESKPKENK
jgi:hypothetical protein